MARSDETRPAEVTPATGAKQAGETRPTEWAWVERTVWTSRMLEALERGVKGGVWYSLMDKVFRKATLRRAFERVQARKGGSGVDGQTIEQFGERLESELERLERELRTGSYRPRPIKRRWIPKPGSREKRPLGIPAVRDRVVQAALVMVLGPIFEREFVDTSYGFRPERGAKDALRRVQELLDAGYVWVVDADLKGYFDSIPKDRLRKAVSERVADGRVLALVDRFLEQPVLDGLESWTPIAGTPQGAVLSPLLANLYLHPVDQEVAAAGYEMVRYADDFVILCRSREEAEAALALVERLIAERGLTLHPDKTRIVHTTDTDGKVRFYDSPHGFDFLGYHFEGRQRWPRAKSLRAFKDRLRNKTRPNNGRSLDETIADCNRTLRGWFGYFKHSHRWTFRPLDQWLRRRLRTLLRRHQHRHGISKKGLDHQRWPNAFFTAHGLFCLEAARAACLRSGSG